MTKVETDSFVPNHFPLLDVLRAGAAFLVLLGHTRNWIFTNIGAVEKPGPLLKFFWLATALEQEAVVVFFVISGFLIGGALINSIGRKKFDLTSYFVARFVRIYIVFGPAMIVTGLAFWIGSNVLTDFGEGTIRPLFSERQPDLGGVRQALCHIAGLQGFLCNAWKENPVLWSLGYEWAIYLFAPALLGILMLRRSLSLRIGAFTLLFCAIAAMSINPENWIFWISVWFLGALASLIVRKFTLPFWVGVSGLVIMLGGMAVSRLYIFGLFETNAIIACGAGLAVACRSLVSFKFAARFFSWAASFSYSLYATHVPLIFLTIAALQNMGFPTRKTPPNPGAFLAFVICVAISVAFAYLFSIFAEQQTGRVRSRIALLRHRPSGQNVETLRMQPLPKSVQEDTRTCLE